MTLSPEKRLGLRDVLVFYSCLLNIQTISHLLQLGERLRELIGLFETTCFDSNTLGLNSNSHYRNSVRYRRATVAPQIRPVS